MTDQALLQLPEATVPAYRHTAFCKRHCYIFHGEHSHALAVAAVADRRAFLPSAPNGSAMTHRHRAGLVAKPLP